MNNKNEEKPLPPSKTTKILEMTIQRTAQMFIEKWKQYNPESPVDIRINYNRNKIPVKSGKIEGYRFQAVLLFEMKIDGVWNVIIAKPAEFPSAESLENAEASGLLTLGLWNDMFAEIAHMGFITVITRKRVEQHTKDHDQEQKIYPIRPDQAVGKEHSKKSRASRKASN